MHIHTYFKQPPVRDDSLQWYMRSFKQQLQSQMILKRRTYNMKVMSVVVGSITRDINESQQDQPDSAADQYKY